MSSERLKRGGFPYFSRQQTVKSLTENSRREIFLSLKP
ncbi:hypothetical protein B4113_3303 [Geobacillus sp. B4113_201601]|nr:hypothetical protein B4113_3303 [Geobacillus sp. B4113_201601]